MLNYQRVIDTSLSPKMSHMYKDEADKVNTLLVICTYLYDIHESNNVDVSVAALTAPL